MIPTDVADPAQVESAAEQVEKTFGPIDIWINNAMTTVFSEFKDMNPEEFKRVTEVTYLGTVHGTMAALKRMLPRDEGTIVQVGSALADRSIPLQSAYCGAKHAIRGFTEALRRELSDTQTRCKNQLRALLHTGDHLERDLASGHLSDVRLKAIIRRRGTAEQTRLDAIRREEARRLAQAILDRVEAATADGEIVPSSFTSVKDAPLAQ